MSTMSGGEPDHPRHDFGMTVMQLGSVSDTAPGLPDVFKLGTLVAAVPSLEQQSREKGFRGAGRCGIIALLLATMQAEAQAILGGLARRRHRMHQTRVISGNRPGKERPYGPVILPTMFLRRSIRPELHHA